MKKHYVRTTLFLLLLAQLAAHAGGFQLNTQGVRQLGMAHTGTGLAMDGSVLFFNPGQLPFLKNRFVVTGGVSFLLPRTIYKEPEPGFYREYMVPNTSTPVHLYAAFRADSASRFAFGLGVYNPYGSRAQWPSGWKGQFIIREISLTTFYIQPTAAYRITDWLSAGAGFVYATGSFSLAKGVPVQNMQEEYGDAVLEGAASGMGWNAGLAARFKQGLSFGLSMRSGVQVEVSDGNADFTVPASVATNFPDGKFSTKLRLPSTISFGAGYTKDKLQLALDINRTGWSSYDTLNIDFEQNTEKLADVHSAREYKDVFTVRLGANYIINEHVEVRGGLYFDQTPVQNGYLTPETPDSDRIGITAGTTYNINEKIGINLFYLYTQGKNRTDTNLETGFSGTYKTIANGFGASVAVQF